MKTHSRLLLVPMLLWLGCVREPVSDAVPGTDAEVDGATDSATPPADSGPVDPCPGCPRSALYPDDWTPDVTDTEGRFLHDFSYAGYSGGDEPPDVSGPVVSVLDHGADPTGAIDSNAAFQAALDQVAGTGGGVVYAPAGLYRLDDLLTVTGSGVVLRGAGAGLTRLAFARDVAMTDQASISFAGALTYGPDLPLVEDAANRSREVRVADATSLAPGDDVVVGWIITAGFIADHGMTGTWTAFTDQYKEVFRREVVEVDTGVTPHRVVLDVPLRYPVLMAYGASLRVESGHLSEVGVEDLSVSNAIEFDTAWSFDRAHAVLFRGVKDGWLRRVTSFETPLFATANGGHLQSGGVKLLESKRVTVAEVVFEQAQNRGSGGNGYLFEISKSNEVLVRDSIGIAGRHNFIQNWDFGTAGCVWLRTSSALGRMYGGLWDPLGFVGFSEYHHSLAMANLVDDSVTDDGWQAMNRGTESTGAGHVATESVFWNLRGTGVLNSWQYGHGYIIGTDGLWVDTAVPAVDLSGRSTGTAPEDWTELIDAGDTLWPPSLYEDQRARRLAGP